LSKAHCLSWYSGLITCGQSNTLDLRVVTANRLAQSYSHLHWFTWY
jgi:hypothetical protein